MRASKIHGHIFNNYFKILKKNLSNISIYIVTFLALIVMFTTFNHESKLTSFEQEKHQIIFVDNDNTEFSKGLKTYLSQYAIFTDKYKTESDIKDASLADKTATSLSKVETVTMRNFNVGTSGMNLPKQFFNFLCYGVINIIFLGVSSIMIAYNRKEIRDRAAVGVIKPVKFNLQLFLGHLCYTVFVFLCTIVLSLIFIKPDLTSKQYWLFYLNVFCLCITLLSISFLIGLFVTNRNIQSALTNVISLGLSFFSGVFVPQDVMNENVISVARFTPTYWYCKATNDIAGLSSFSNAALQPIFTSILIELAFAAAFIAVALVVSKQRESK